MALFQTYSLSNRQRLQNPRALIDAYGNDRTCGSTLNKVISTSWQNTEEQEFDWKDMNRPTIGFSTEKPVPVAARMMFPCLTPNIEYRPPVLPAPRPCPLKNPVRNPSESINVANSTIVSHGFPNQDQLLHGVENNGISKRNLLHQLSNQPAGLISSSNPRPVVPLFPPAGGLHAPIQMLPHPNYTSPSLSSQQPSFGYSNLINSLLAQGVISLASQAPKQDFVGIGIEFDPDILKVRHESVVSALYGDLPRQCTTCGQRFKSKDEHSSHMDWHVTKNRSMSKNRKQKPSRKWFVNETMLLEALGNESAPALGFLPAEEENKEDEQEFAVPAEENQNTCALCGESFDQFYSDETEEWMFRGAVYLNAPNGSMDRSQLGFIVHAKCGSDTPRAYEGNQKKRMSCEEGNQRKRMRSRLVL